MDSAEDRQKSQEQPEVPERKLSDAAKRALTEAEERRRARKQAEKAAEAEIGGRGGPDPARYGDWEKDGIISDF